MNDFEMEEFEKKVTYYIVNEGRNKGIIVAYGNWPERSIRHFGWGRELASRYMTDDEIAYEKTCTRYHFDRYETIEALLADEKKIVSQDIYDMLYQSFAKSFQINPLQIKHKPKQLKLFNATSQIPHS